MSKLLANHGLHKTEDGGTQKQQSSVVFLSVKIQIEE